MKFYFNSIFIAIVLCLIIVDVSAAFISEKQYPSAANKLILNTEKFSEYKRLAKKIGVEYGEKYSYSDYADNQRFNKVGIAGNYDFLKLSTGGTEWEGEDTQRFNRQSCGWRMTYYKNHNLTVIDEVCRDPDRIHSWVRMLKIAKGKRPNLNLE